MLLPSSFYMEHVFFLIVIPLQLKLYRLEQIKEDGSPLFQWPLEKVQGQSFNSHPCSFCRVVRGTISVLPNEGKKENPQTDEQSMRCYRNLELLTLGLPADVIGAER